VRDAKKNDPEPYHAQCRRCSSCYQVIPKDEVQKVAGRLLCQSCSNLFGHFFNPDRRSETERMKETFRAWDRDGSGSIEKEEVRRVLKALDPDFAERDLDELMRTIDKNGDGIIDFEEFCEWITQEPTFEIGEGSLEECVGGLMRTSGVAEHHCKMGVAEVQVRPDGVVFVLENGSEIMQSNAIKGDTLEMVVLDPEEFIVTVECTELGLILTLNTGRRAVAGGRGDAFGPWQASEGFHIVGLTTKPREDTCEEQRDVNADGGPSRTTSRRRSYVQRNVDLVYKIVDVNLAPLPAAKSYSPGAALRFAAAHEYLYSLGELLSKAASDVNSFSPAGRTALMIASEQGNIGAMRLLLSSKAKIDVCDADGWTALTYASRRGQTTAVNMLLEKGAKPDGDGGAALRACLRFQHNSSARALLRAGFGPAPEGAFSLESRMDPSNCKLRAPQVTPGSGAFADSVTVELAPGDGGGEGAPAGKKKLILYTLDGRDPFTAGKRYRGPFTIHGARTRLRAVTVQGNERSPVAESVYVVCHYVMPEEVISGSLKAKTVPEALVYVHGCLAEQLGVPKQRVTCKVKTPDTPPSGSTSPTWLRVGLKDPHPRHRMRIDRPYMIVKGAKNSKAFVDKFVADVHKATGVHPTDVSLAAGSIVVTFALPREQALEVMRQLDDSTSYLSCNARLKDMLKETTMTMEDSIGERAALPEVQQGLREALGRVAPVQDFLLYGSGDAGTLAVLVQKDQIKKLKKNLERSLRDQFPNIAQGSALEGPAEIELEYTVDVVSSRSDDNIVNGGTVIKSLSDEDFAKNMMKCVAAQNVPMKVSVLNKATSRELSQLEFVLSWGPSILGKTEVGPIQDYLDAVCLVYAESTLAMVVDYRSAREQRMVHDGEDTAETQKLCRSIARAVQHGGDEMAEAPREQRMRLDLVALPDEVTDVFFVLASFDADDLSLFPNPTVNIYDVRTQRKLTTYNAALAGNSKAVVMCCLSRTDGKWIVNGLGVTAEGNVKNLDEIRTTISTCLGGYLRWERRSFLVKLRVLYNCNRITKSSTSEFAHVLHNILTLPIAAFQILMQWL